MDATYKTCKLALPLFLLVVKTNVGYQCVGTFVIETEDKVSLEEALTIIKKHLVDNDINVESFMVDCSPTEIGALREVYPGTVIVITSLFCILKMKDVRYLLKVS